MSDSTEGKVLHCDIAAIQYCNRGARIFFEQHGMSWSDFRENGVSFDRLRKTGDDMAIKAIEQAQRRINANVERAE